MGQQGNDFFSFSFLIPPRRRILGARFGRVGRAQRGGVGGLQRGDGRGPRAGVRARQEPRRRCGAGHLLLARRAGLEGFARRSRRS